MTTSNLIDSLTEGNHEIKCKVCDFFLEYESVKNNLIKHKCLSWNKNYSNKIDEGLKKDSRTHLSFLIMKPINLFFVKKGCFSSWVCEQMEKTNETSLPEKKFFIVT